MYSMWNETFYNVYGDYLKKKSGRRTKCEPFYFTVGKEIEKPKCNFSIEELDLLTTAYSNEQALIEALAKYGEKYLRNYPNTPIIITHNAKNRVYEDTILYNNLWLRKIAFQKVKQKREKKKEDLKYEEGIAVLISYLKTLAIHPFTQKYLLDPYKVKGLTLEDKTKLEQALKDDVNLSTKYASKKQGIRSLLKDSIMYDNLIEGQKRLGDYSLELELEQNQLKRKLVNHFTKDYKKIREIFVWEQIFEDILKKEIKKESPISEEAKDTLSYIEAQKKYRNGKIDREVLECYQEMFFIDRSELEERKPTVKDVKNERMLELYLEGGIEQVMAEMDANEIYRDMEDAIALGIIPRQKTNRKKK